MTPEHELDPQVLGDHFDRLGHEPGRLRVEAAAWGCLAGCRSLVVIKGPGNADARTF